jgi:hypothetical protein
MEGSSGPQEEDLSMTPEFEEALGLWESGELSRDELARRFPDEDVAGLLDAFDGMSAASAGPTPDAAVAWAAMRTRLPARLADRRRGQGKAIRLLAAALIAVLVLGASAYAVVPSVRRAVNDAASAITRDDDRSEPIDPAESAEEPTSNVTDDVGSTTDRDEGAAEENEGDANGDADELDADDDTNAGSNDAEEVDGSGSGSDGGSLDDGSDQDGGSGGETSGSEEERASGGVDNDGPDSGSEDPEN